MFINLVHIHTSTHGFKLIQVLAHTENQLLSGIFLRRIILYFGMKLQNITPNCSIPKLQELIAVVLICGLILAHRKQIR